MSEENKMRKCKAPLREPIQYDGKHCGEWCRGHDYGRAYCEYFWLPTTADSTVSYSLRLRCHECVEWTEMHSSKQDEIERLRDEIEELKGILNNEECDSAFWKERSNKFEAELKIMMEKKRGAE